MLLQYDKLVRETNMARLIRFDDAEVWIPNSQVDYFDEDEKQIDIADWLVDKHGLEGYEI